MRSQSNFTTPEAPAAQATVERLSASNQDLRKKLNKTRKLLALALVPWAILLFPLTILAACVWGIKKWSKASKSRKTFEHIGKSGRVDKDSVVDAFLLLQQGTVDAARKALDTLPEPYLSRTRRLFSSINATTDDKWERDFNGFLEATDQSPVRLKPGSAPRFQRINFQSNTVIEDGPLVSVLMPTFNCEHTVDTAVLSILNQTWRNLELIIVDDHSTDATADILHRLAKEDSRVKVVVQRENGGPYVAKNVGLAHATGAFITGHDADDLAFPDRIERQLAPMLNDTSVGATMAQMIRLDSNAGFSWPGRIGNASYDGVHRLAFISLMLRKEILSQHLGHWDTVRFGADSELIARTQAVLGKGVIELPDLVMLCLHENQGLTSDSQHGIQFTSGLSPTRLAYKEAWGKWHQTLKAGGHYLDFPHHGSERHFPAPQAMQVSQATIDSLAAGEHPRTAAKG